MECQSIAQIAEAIKGASLVLGLCLIVSSLIVAYIIRWSD
jgi:hypothetical protein